MLARVCVILCALALTVGVYTVGMLTSAYVLLPAVELGMMVVDELDACELEHGEDCEMRFEPKEDTWY